MAHNDRDIPAAWRSLPTWQSLPPTAEAAAVAIANAIPPEDWLAATRGTIRREGDGEPETGHQGQVSITERAERAEARAAVLERALASRPGIDRAKGLLMGVFGLSADDALEALVWVSQKSNTTIERTAERFLDAAGNLDLGPRAGGQITTLLAELAAQAPDTSS